MASHGWPWPALSGHGRSWPAGAAHGQIATVAMTIALTEIGRGRDLGPEIGQSHYMASSASDKQFRFWVVFQFIIHVEAKLPWLTMACHGQLQQN